MSHLSHNGSFYRQVFTGNQLQWYSTQTYNNNSKIHAKQNYTQDSVNICQTCLLPYAHSNSQRLRLRLNCSLVSVLCRSYGSLFQIVRSYMRKLWQPKRVDCTCATINQKTHTKLNPNKQDAVYKLAYLLNLVMMLTMAHGIISTNKSTHHSVVLTHL